MTGTFTPVFHQFDQSRTEESKNNYHLSLQISIDGFCFALFHLQERKYIGIAEYVIPSSTNILVGDFIASIILNDPWLTGDFKSVSVGLSISKNTLIPLALFEENQLTNYLELNSGIDSIGHPGYDRLLKTESVNCYSQDLQLANIISYYYPSAQFIHQNSTLIEATAQVTNKQPFIHIQFNRMNIDLAVFIENQLHLQNSFDYKTTEDVIYYLLYVMEQLALSQEKTILYISGNIVKDSNVYQLLYKYIKDIELVELPKQVEYSQPIRLAEPHHYYLLIQQYLCA
tara:strand:+ start:1309 stop:2166 length:858 start_codon:yes stop_codon:yes gene_type:complete